MDLEASTSLPKGKMLDLYKFKAFADDKLHVKFFCDRVEKIEEKGENTSCHIKFSKALFQAC